MRRCAYCQGELDPATLICRACGRVQPQGDEDITLVPPARVQGAQVRRCPHCDALLPAAARFCGRCGRALALLGEETAGGALHDTGKPPEAGRRDEAITNVLKQPVKLADMPARTPADTPKASLAAGGAARRHDMDTRQGPGGVAHGLRYRLLSRMQARIITTALVALLVIGGTAYSQAGLPLSSSSSGIPTPTAAVATATAAAPTPTATSGPVTPGVTPTPGSVTPLATPTPRSVTPGVTPTSVTPAVTATAAAAGGNGDSSASGSVGTLVARIVLLISIIGILILLIVLGVLFFRRVRARSDDTMHMGTPLS